MTKVPVWDIDPDWEVVPEVEDPEEVVEDLEVEVWLEEVEDLEVELPLEADCVEEVESDLLAGVKGTTLLAEDLWVDWELYVEVVLELLLCPTLFWFLGTCTKPGKVLPDCEVLEVEVVLVLLVVTTGEEVVVVAVGEELVLVLVVLVVITGEEDEDEVDLEVVCWDWVFLFELISYWAVVGYKLRGLKRLARNYGEWVLS